MNEINLDSGKVACSGECTPGIEPSADRKTYNTVCTMCGKVLATKVFTKDINFYSAPGQYFNNWNSGGLNGSGAPTGTVMSEGDMLFSRITLQPGGSFIMGNGTADYVRNGGWDTTYTVFGGSGRYAVFKMRGSGVDDLGLILWDGVTANWGDGTRLRRTATDIGDNTWRVYVVDLEAFNYSFYKAGQSSITKLMAGFMADNDSVTRHIDLAYFAICDDWSEIAEVAAGEKNVFVTSWTGKAELLESTPTGTCMTGHTPAVSSVSGGTVNYICSVCETAIKSVSAPAGVNFYSLPGQYYNNWATGGFTSEKTLPTGKVMEENGEFYLVEGFDSAMAYAFSMATYIPATLVKCEKPAGDFVRIKNSL
jgi:hypothetical protein